MTDNSKAGDLTAGVLTTEEATGLLCAAAKQGMNVAEGWAAGDSNHLWEGRNRVKAEAVSTIRGHDVVCKVTFEFEHIRDRNAGDPQ